MPTVLRMTPERIMQLQDISNLPPLAIIAFGMSLAILYFVTKGGFSSGQNSTPTSSAATAQVAAVVVDPSALNRATAAIEAQTFEAINHRKSIERAVDDITECMRELTRGIAQLREEMIRKGR